MKCEESLPRFMTYVTERLFISLMHMIIFSGVFSLLFEGVQGAVQYSAEYNTAQSSTFMPFGEAFGDVIMETKEIFKEIAIEKPLVIYGKEYSSIVVSF